jgi:MFS family permease
VGRHSCIVRLPKSFVNSTESSKSTNNNTTTNSGYAAPVLAIINADIGPDSRYVWISLVYTVVLSVMGLIVGRLSDIFGRRYFMVGGAVLAVIGCLICATAKSVTVLIGGNVFLGVASACQLSFSYVQAELVPMKYRYLSSAGIYRKLISLLRGITLKQSGQWLT